MKLLILLFMLMFIGCRSSKIAFEYDVYENRLPSVLLLFPSSNGKFEKLRSGLDTGAENCVFYNNAEEKIFGSKDYIKELCAKENINIDDMKADEVLFFEVNDIRCSKFLFTELWIKQTKDKGNGLDGLLGYKAFKDYGVIVFDFRKNILTIGKRKVSKNVFPMKIKRFDSFHTKLLTIPVEIDGKIIDVILDTGFSSKGKYCLATDDWLDLQKKSCVKIGDIEYKNVEYVAFEDVNFANKLTQNNTKTLFKDCIILGNAFFKNHRIQLDFENMTFAMD